MVSARSLWSPAWDELPFVVSLLRPLTLANVPGLLILWNGEDRSRSPAPGLRALWNCERLLSVVTILGRTLFVVFLLRPHARANVPGLWVLWNDERSLSAR